MHTGRQTAHKEYFRFLARHSSSHNGIAYRIFCTYVQDVDTNQNLEPILFSFIRSASIINLQCLTRFLRHFVAYLLVLK